MEYQDRCAGCGISQELRRVPGGIVKLAGNWVVNQYGSSEGFLGWLALQPRYHRNEISQLTRDELSALGPNIQSLDRSLRQYWHLHFPGDELCRVYVVYFFESEFQDPPQDPPYHLHIHIIPRPSSFDTADRLRRVENGVRWVDGWRTPNLMPRGVVPAPYQRGGNDWEHRVAQLSAYLRGELNGW